MAFSVPYTFDSQTIGATEVDLTSNTTPIQSRATPGLYSIVIDTANMTFGDRYRFRIYEKATAAATQRVLDEVVITGPLPQYTRPGLHLVYGWTFSLQRLTGTDRAFSWSVRAVT